MPLSACIQLPKTKKDIFWKPILSGQNKVEMTDSSRSSLFELASPKTSGYLLQGSESTQKVKLDDTSVTLDTIDDLSEVALDKTAGFTDVYCQSVLVTGGVGFVGSHVAEALLTEGRKVVVYDIFNSETSTREQKLDIAKELKRVAKGIDGASLTTLLKET